MTFERIAGGDLETGLFFGFLGWPEITAILVIFFILFLSRSLTHFSRGMGEFLRASERIREELRLIAASKADPAVTRPRLPWLAAAVLWIAEGFGSGRFLVGPGTAGSLVGLLWFALLLSCGSFPIFVVAAVAYILVAVEICGDAEKILGQKDPSSVVLDEIVALPICFLALVAIQSIAAGSMPPASRFFDSNGWPWTLGVFATFRLFDIWKPWPIRQSQSLPGGWGVVMDDVFAAVYVNIVVVVAWLVFPSLFH